MQKQISNRARLDASRQLEIIKLKRFIQVVLRNWHFLLLSMTIAAIGTYLYFKFTIPVYLTTASLLIKEEENRAMPDADDLFQGFGLHPGAQNLDNQIQIITSWAMISRALDNLSYEYDCYKKGLLRKVSFYPMSPVQIIPDPNKDILYNNEFSIYPIDDFQCKIKIDNGFLNKKDTVVHVDKRFDYKSGSYNVLIDYELLEAYGNLKKVYAVFRERDRLIGHYRSRLNIQRSSREGSVIILSLEGPNKVKDRMFLEKLTEVFLASNLEKKNHEANRIIEFIDEQLVDVSDSLIITENRLQEFRSRNLIMDVSAQTQQIIDQAVALENERARLTLESNYYEYLTEYLSKENNEEIPISPSTMDIEDPLLSVLMQELSALQSEYFSSGAGERNPLQAQFELKIENKKKSIRETLQGIVRANNMAIEENSEQIKNLNDEAARLPVKERQLLGIERKFNLNNVLYTFLLQQRAEAKIQKASNKPDNELIDPARTELNPISPNSLIAFPLALFIGLGIPLLVLFLKFSFNTKINNEDDLKMITDLPVIGYVPHSKLDYQTVVLNESQSNVAEAFRSIRARMEYFTKNTRNPVILVTSSLPGEGKSFIAMNLASAYSLTGKSTVMLGFDLRLPKLSPDLQVDQNKGISTYLIGKNNINDIISNTDYKNLDIIPAGPVPPNPSELIESDKTKQIISELKKKYDYIIIDSAPIGTISDSYPLASIADATVLVVRNGKSIKKPFEATLAEINEMGIHGISLIVNDIKISKNSYRYSYKYKYGYKSTEEIKMS